MLRLACLLSVLAAGGVLGQVSNGGSPECRGVFDFYFVLDRSGSTLSALRDQVVPFVRAVSQQYVDPNLRLSITTFSTTPVPYLPLTRSGETAVVEAALDQISTLFGNGMTILAPALQIVGEQIETLGGDTASVILVVTDGHLTDGADAIAEANRLREMYGARIYTIGVGTVNVQELHVVADSQAQSYIGQNFEFLETIVDRIIQEICIEITSVSPGRVCLGSTFEIRLNGSGFTNQLDQEKARCRFKTESGESIETRPTDEPVTDTTFVCPAPQFETGGHRSVVLQVSTNGVTFVSSSVTLEIDDCMSFSNVQPDRVCASVVSKTEVTLTGSGFTSSPNQTMAACRFTTIHGELYVTQASRAVTSTQVVCPLPDIAYVGQLSIEVTTDGSIFLDEIGTMEIEDCTRIDSVEPQRICNGTEREVKVRGVGFSLDVEKERANCSFTTEDGETFYTSPAAEITDTLLVCPLPDVNYTGNLELAVSTNGKEYFDETVTIAFVICLPKTPKDLTIIAWIFLALIGAALLLGLCLMWLFLPLMTCRIVGGLPPEPKEETPEPPPTPPPPPEPLPAIPGRKWAVVDASYYGGRGAGGITPMKVKWGDKGATEEGSKLQKTEDAKLITVVETPGIPAPPLPPKPAVAVVPVIPPKTEPGCWDRFKKRVKRMYAVAASYRPVRGPTKRILWFPGPKGIKKAQNTPMANGTSINGSAVSNGSSRAPPRASMSSRPPPPPPYTGGSRRAPPKPPVATTPSRENLLP